MIFIKKFNNKIFQLFSKLSIKWYLKIWLRRVDLNHRPPGYEPDELPNCSTPRQVKLGYGWGKGIRTPDDWTKTSCLTAWLYPN